MVTRVFRDLRKDLEFLRHQETNRTPLQLHADHTRVRPVSGSERVVDIHIAEFSRNALTAAESALILFPSLSLTEPASSMWNRKLSRRIGSGRARL